MHCDDIVLMLPTPRTIEVETKFTETDVPEFFRSMEKCRKETCRHTQVTPKKHTIYVVHP